MLLGLGGRVVEAEDQEGDGAGCAGGGAMNEAVRAVDLLHEKAGAACPRVLRGAEGLTLAEAGDAVDGLAEVMDLVWAMLGPVLERVEQIRNREITERRDGSGLDVLDEALVNARCGLDGLLIAKHLLVLGQGGLLRVERGED